MKQVFISYARRDFSAAQKIRDALLAGGFDVWTDTDSIDAGAHWGQSIDEAIIACDLLVVLASTASARSTYVTYEWSFAIGLGIPVVPIVLENCVLHPRVAAIQGIPLIENAESLMARLQEAIEDILDRNRPMIRRKERLLESALSEDRKSALQWLVSSGHPNALATVLKLIRDGQPPLQVEAALELSKTHHVTARNYFLDRFAQANHGERHSIARILVGNQLADVIENIVTLAVGTPDTEQQPFLTMLSENYSAELALRELPRSSDSRRNEIVDTLIRSIQSSYPPDV